MLNAFPPTCRLVAKFFRHASIIFFLILLCAWTVSAQTTTTTTSITDGRTPSGMQSGSPAGSYELSGFDNVNLFNGNLNFHLPLLQIGGRGGAGYTMTLALNLKSWHIKHQHKDFPDGSTLDSYTPTQTGWVPYSGYSAGRLDGRNYGLHPSSNLTCGRYYSKTLSRLTFSTADGTEYELRDQFTNGQPLDSTCTQGAYRGTIFATADGTSATFISDSAIYDNQTINPLGPTAFSVSGYLLLRDGTRYRIDGSNVTWIRDRNGNKVSFFYASDRMTVTDSLGRTVTVFYDITEDAPYGLCDKIVFSGFGGAQRIIRVSHATLENALRPNSGYSIKNLGGANGLFPESDGSASTQYNPIVATKVWLPDDGVNFKSYSLYYNSYGELARAELPTGGAYEYDMTPSSGVICGGAPCTSPDDDHEIYRRVVERRVYPDGSAGSTFERKTVYANTEAVGTPSSIITTETQDRYGAVMARERHYFDGSALDSLFGGDVSSGYGAWYEGHEQKTEILDTSGTFSSATVLRRIVNTWAQRASVSWWATYASLEHLDTTKEPPNDPRLTRTATTIEPSGANLVTVQTAINPSDGTIGFDQYNNQTETWEYDYGTGAAPTYPIRHTHTTFLTTNAVNGQDYASPTPTSSSIHIRNLPQEQKVYSVNTQTGAETLVSRSVIAYDQGSLTPYTSVVGLCDAIDANNQCVWSNPTSFTTRGNVTGTTAYTDAANGTGALTTSMTYDIAGNLKERTDARGKTSTFTYSDSYSDSTNRNTYAFLTSTTSPVPDPTGNYGSTTALTTSGVYDYSTGHVYSSTDANGQTSYFSYNDLLDRLKTITKPDTDSNGNHGTTTFSYGDAVGNLYVRTQVKQSATQTTDSYQYFDGLGRATRSFMYDGYSSEPWSVVDKHYDTLGRTSQVSNPYRVSSSNATVPNCSSSIPCTTTDYDILGRIKSVTTPDGAVVSTSYNGNQVLVTDQVGRQRMSKTNALGQLTDVWEVTPNNASTYPGIISFSFGAQNLYGYLTHYDYDGLGNLTNVSQGVQTRSFTYDSLSRLQSATNPEACHQQGTSCTPVPVTYQYDNNGNLTQKTDARGVVTTYGYDNLNRNTTVTYTEVPGVHTPNVTRIYDKAFDSNGNAIIIPNGKGQLCQSKTSGDEGTLTTINSFDATGRPLSQSTQFYSSGAWGTPFGVGRTYDLAGHVLTQSYPSGHTVAYSYDLAGRLNDFNNQPAFSGNLGDGETRTYASSLQYDAASRLQQERYETLTPLYHKLHYNVRGQLWDVRLSTRSLATSEWDWNRGAIVSYYSSVNGYAGGTSGTDNNGNALRSQSWIPIVNSSDNITESRSSDDFFEYDALNRLTSITEYPNLTNALPNQGDQQANYQGAESSAIAQQYTYDRYGNRTINQSGTYGTGVNNLDFGVNTANNRLTAPANYQPLEYDDAGNLTKDPTSLNPSATSIYDAENRLSTIEFPSENVCYPDGEGGQNCYPTPAPPSIRYIYDANGRRVRRYSYSEKIWQVYGMDGELLAEYYQGSFQGGTEQDATVTNIIPRKEYGYRSGQLLITVSNGDNERVERFITNFYYAALGRAPLDNELTQQKDIFIQASQQGEAQLVAAVQQFGRQLFDLENSGGAYNSRNRTDAQYVIDLYNAYMQRAPENGGVGFWVGEVAANGRISVRSSFDGSGEFSAVVSTLYGITNSTRTSEQINRYLERLYIGALGAPSYSSQDVSTLDLAAAQGQSQVIAAARTIGINLFQSTAYTSRNRTDPEYVTDLFEAFMQREPASSEVATWVQSVQSQGRTSVLNQFASLTAVQSVAGTLWHEMLWMVEDQLGTPRMIADRSGSLSGVKRHDYLPFGEELFAGMGGRTTAQGYVADSVRQKFTGYERDIETSLDYAEARYYSSTQGRFISVDPENAGARITDPQSWNGYPYASNNPLKYVDPTGLDTVCRQNGKIVSCAYVLDQIRQGNFETVTYTNSAGVSITVRRADFYSSETSTRADGTEVITTNFNQTAFLSAAANFVAAAQASLNSNEPDAGTFRFSGRGGDAGGSGAGGKYDCPSCPAFRDDPYNRDVVRGRRDARNAGQTETPSEAANRLGFTRRIPPQRAPFDSHGQEVFTDGRRYITPDIDAHRGGAWKMFDKDGRRLGTYNSDLTRRIGP